MANPWSQLVGSLMNTLLQGRNQGDFVFVDQSDIEPSAVGAGAGGAPPSEAPAPPMWVQAHAQIETLQKADTNFLESVFLSQASKTFAALLAAEGAMNADAVAGLVTPSFLDQFERQIDTWRNAGLTRTVSDMSLDPATTFKVAIGGALQCIMVRFTGSAKRFSKDDMTGLITEGSVQPESFSEFATFVRPAGSTTPKTGVDGGPSHCSSKCSFCGAALSGTGGAWLLDKMSVSAYT